MKATLSRSQARFSRFCRRISPLFFVSLFLFSLVAPSVTTRISAATCTSISDCQSQIDANNDAVADLKKTALSYKDAIEKLNSEISTLQGAIDTNVAEQNRLQHEIEKAQVEIDHQRSILAQGVKAMYVDGTPSTLEMIAASKSLSDYVDKQEYRTAVQRKLQDTLRKIAELQKQLSEQRVQVAELLKTQQTQQATLVSARAEQTNMLAYNQSQQDAYNKQTAANKDKLEDLIAAQRAANNNFSGGGIYFIRVPGTVQSHDSNVDDYPYRNDGFSMQLGPCSNSDSYPDSPDRWGYCTRQCVSYAAWAVERSGRTAPKYWGSAKNWVNAAPASWVHTTPEVGDIAISTKGTWGHAMYVEAVSDDGSKILVSQYNAQLTGQYSTAWRSY